MNNTSYDAILQNIKHPRSRWSAVTSVNGKIYAFGGKAQDPAAHHGRHRSRNQNQHDEVDGVDGVEELEEKQVQVVTICRSSVEMYNPLDQSWKALPPMNKERRTCACAVIGSKIYIVGGHEILPTATSTDQSLSLSSVEVFDTITESFTSSLSPNIIPRWGCAAAAIGKKLYVFGGLCEKSVEVYDVEEEGHGRGQGQWRRLPDMYTDRYYPISVVVGTNIYVMGGSKRCSMEVFDTVRNKWYRGPSMKHPLYNGSCNATVIDGKIVLFGNSNADLKKEGGGTSSCESSSVVLVDTFDIRKKSWRTMYISPTDIDANLTNATASVIGNDVYLIDESNGLLCLSDTERLQLLKNGTIKTTVTTSREEKRQRRFIVGYGSRTTLSSSPTLQLERVFGRDYDDENILSDTSTCIMRRRCIPVYGNYVLLSMPTAAMAVIIAATAIIVLPMWLWEYYELNAAERNISNINSTIDRVVEFLMDPIFPL